MVASEGISFPFDGVPFICVGAANYQCHQGDDIDKKTKIRRQQQQEEKEVVLTVIVTSSCAINAVWHQVKLFLVLISRCMTTHLEKDESIFSQLRSLGAQVN